ncbi:hypothetical protein SmJEL517_g01878 [Synchytrium microbalum]|uniref:Peptidase C19 ubiquitin carboxyl-terminal hydrolase domain-containing protein n=1 Tax=Synchytrium microbalum TaxID=1806994 RepID=A0A507C8V3_9FUNG|nr:uncharacterized protein SmJEL517_g01878 [Synchytrium microbalum]TPX35768.1 hypothetical protein SmJEL517_g01878 [Synchytrium microbalum]
MIEIVVTPPEESGLEPIQIFQPGDIAGLPNDKINDLQISKLNATLQVFFNLPYLTCELPVNSHIPDIHQFATNARIYHTSPKEAFKDLNYDCILRHMDETAPYEQVISTLLDTIIAQTRFGDRFFIECPNLAKSKRTRKKDSAVDITDPSSSDESSDDEIDIPPSVLESGLGRRLTRRKSYARMRSGMPAIVYPTYLTLDVSCTPNGSTANMLTLIKKRLNHPTTFFFFGGIDSAKDSPQRGGTDVVTAEKIEWSHLPHYLSLVIQRSSDSGSSTCTVDMPMDLDMLFALKDQRNAMGETLYKLHGYTTYADSGKMVAITRCRESKTWYRCLDDEVTETDPLMGLGSVRSRGVVFAMYRLQERLKM